MANDKIKLPRDDIQALRGLAVFLVVFYHTKIFSISAGYLGVDVFFVISGYLITTMVASSIDRGTFCLVEFYFRRAQRLLPAAYTTFAVTAFLAPWFLNQSELRDFAIQMLGAVTFTGNFVLWQQTGYFQGSSELKPLLHMWSLAIEEQYYFILPAALLIIPRRRRLADAVALAALSLSLCIAGGVWKPVATFYLIPTRAWELLIGSIGALWLMHRNQGKAGVNVTEINILFLPALFSLALIPFMPFGGIHPGINAVIICFATIVVILRNSHCLNVALPTKALARVGDFSYSLYLVHWPIVAFMKNAWVGPSGEAPYSLRLTALALSFVLAYLLYWFIEEPIRHIRIKLSRKSIGLTSLSSILLIAITPVAISSESTKIDFKVVRRPNYGLSEVCEYKASFVPMAQCQTTLNAPTLLVWGDSYAMHLVPGLAQDWGGEGLIQATRSGCGPFTGLAPRQISKIDEDGYKNHAWAESCIEFNQSVIDYLHNASSIETVVLSSPFSQYLTTDNSEHIVLVDNKFISIPVQMNNAIASLRRTVESIRKLGKKVALVAPPPSSDFSIGDCLERQLSNSVQFGGREDCAIDRSDYEFQRSNVLTFLNLTSIEADVSIIRFDSELCDANTCKTIIDGTMIYRDKGHFTYDGSILMAKRMQLSNRIRTQAR